jgi:hypothetical protein
VPQSCAAVLWHGDVELIALAKVIPGVLNQRLMLSRIFGVSRPDHCGFQPAGTLNRCRGISAVTLTSIRKSG